MKRAFYACALALAVPVLSSASPMKPGKWQMTVATETPGSPSRAPQTFVRCVTPEETEKLEPPRAMKSSFDCKVSGYDLSGRVMRWSVKCSKLNIVGGGKIMYNDDTYSGQLKLKLGEEDMIQTFSGKLLGECDKKETK